MPTTRLVPFTSGSRATGISGAGWNFVGAEPRLSANDGRYLQFPVPVAGQNDSQSADGTNWRTEAGHIFPWYDKNMTYMRVYIIVANPTAALTRVGIAAANSSLSDFINLGAYDINMGTSPTVVQALFGPVSAPPTRSQSVDYLRDWLLNQDLLFSFIVSNLYGYTSWYVNLETMFVDVTWDYKRGFLPPTEY